MCDHADDVDDLCVICLEPIETTFTAFRCGHKLHNTCLSHYLYHSYDVRKKIVSCPVCRGLHETDLTGIVNLLFTFK